MLQVTYHGDLKEAEVTRPDTAGTRPVSSKSRPSGLETPLLDCPPRPLTTSALTVMPLTVPSSSRMVKMSSRA